MKSEVLVLGYFGYLSNQLDGQTVKTRNVYELLKSYEIDIGVVNYFDTQNFQLSKFSVFEMISKMINCKKLIYLPAHNNLKFLFPLIYIISIIKRIDILYLVVGGWLSDYLCNKKLHIFLLRRIKGIFTETDLLKYNLEYFYHFQNVEIFPNFRNTSFVPTSNSNSPEFKVVFMARINRMKGLETIFNLAAYIEKDPFYSKKNIKIDFFGPIDKIDEEYFIKEIALHKNTHYVGTIEPHNIYLTLSKYDVLILPTKYYTEGFPGSILDAYISGIPVVVTNWKHATEFVSHNETGFIVPFEDEGNDFIKAVLKLYTDVELLNKMKHKAYEKSKEYSSAGAWEIIKPYLT